MAVSLTAGCGEISAQPLPIFFCISQPEICTVISQVGSLLLDDVGAFVAADHVMARLVVPEDTALVLTGGHGGNGAVPASAPAASAEAASSVPGTSTQAGGLYSDSLLVPAVAASR